MTKATYAYKELDHHMAKARGESLPISMKAAISIANHIRGKDAIWAVEYLDAVMSKKQAVPFTKFTDGVGHRRGKMASGRYPFKAAQHIQAVLKSAIANAANAGLDESLTIAHISANKAASRFHQGRQRRRMMKQTHIQIVLKEAEDKQPKKSTKETKKVEKKPSESKPVKQAPSASTLQPKNEETPATSKVEQKPVEKVEKKVEEKPVQAPKKEEEKKQDNTLTADKQSGVPEVPKND